MATPRGRSTATATRETWPAAFNEAFAAHPTPLRLDPLDLRRWLDGAGLPRRRHDPARGRGRRDRGLRVHRPALPARRVDHRQRRALGDRRRARQPRARAGAGAAPARRRVAACAGRDTVTLSVSAANPNALALYETEGFVRTAQRDRWARPVEPDGTARTDPTPPPARRREPARHGGCPPAVRGRARGARDRLLGDLLHRLGRVAVHGRLLPLPVRAPDPRPRRLVGAAQPRADEPADGRPVRGGGRVLRRRPDHVPLRGRRHRGGARDRDGQRPGRDRRPRRVAGVRGAAAARGADRDPDHARRRVLHLGRRRERRVRDRTPSSASRSAS